jgi:hypothetical protein
MISPKDIVVGQDGRIFVYDVRFRGSGLERELRIVEVDPLSGAQTMRNDSGVGTDTGFSDYRGVGISNSGRIVYFVDFSTSPGGVPGVSSIDFDTTPSGPTTYFRNRVNATGTRLSQGGSGLSVVPQAPEPPEPTFADVPMDYWAFSFIETLAESGITSGCSIDRYCPEDTVTRAQMAVFLERGMNGAGYVPPAATGNVFLDVGAGDFAASFIEQLYFDGITSGCGSNSYCPDAEITRAQMAVFLLRAMFGPGYMPPAPAGVFGDVDLSHWAVAWIERLAFEDITSGCGGGNYCPAEPVTRGQMAVFLVRAFGL